MITNYEIILRLLIGTLLGGIIGFERQMHGRSAGFRTQLLVCVACVLLMLISENYYSSNTLFPRIDPTRLAAGAMTGIGFLGAGVILKTGFTVQGLTTAACIWIVAAIGLAIGAGQYVAGVAGFVITFFSLWFLRLIEARMPSITYRHITLNADETGDEAVIRSLFEDRGFHIKKMDYNIEFQKKEKTYVFTIEIKKESLIKEVIDSVSKLGFVKKLEIKS
jgi:putative Mg2+ transporter-C (MgtC) family protein